MLNININKNKNIAVGSKLIFTKKINAELYHDISGCLKQLSTKTFWILHYNTDQWTAEFNNSSIQDIVLQNWDKLIIQYNALSDIDYISLPTYNQYNFNLLIKTDTKVESKPHPKLSKVDQIDLVQEINYQALGNNIIKITKCISGSNYDQLLTNNYYYEIQLIILDNQNFHADFDYLRQLIANNNAYYHLDPTEQLKINSQLYNLYSKNNYMANLINKKLNQVESKQFESIPPDQVIRMKFMEKIALSILSPVVDICEDALNFIFCENSNYAVTDKADGERTMLFINSVGKLYFVGFNLVKYINCQINDYFNCLFDGELVDSDKGKIYLIFDCLFWNNKLLLEYPLIGSDPTESRYNPTNLEIICKEINKFGINISFDYKTYYFANKIDEFKEQCLTVYQKKYPYQLDGLIFTNKTLSLPQMLANRDIASYRWKPLYHLSIDVLARFDHDPHNPLNIYHDDGLARLRLYTRNSSNYHQLDLLDTLDIKYPIDNVKLYDNIVLELIRQDGQWLPIRNRNYKTILELYDRTDKIKNIEKLIKNQMKLSDLLACNNNGTGAIQQIQLINNNISYFGDNPYRDFIRKHYLIDSINLNNLVKYNIIFKHCNFEKKYPNYLDLACGRSNDMYIWNGQVAYYLGIDIDAKNIETAKKFSLPSKYQFIKTDLTNKKLLSIIQNTTTNKFNIISMQFALHYLTYDEHIIHNIFGTIGKLMQDKGLFIISCLDGQRVYDLLKNKGEIAYYSDYGDLLWKIEPMYSPTESFQNTNQKIDFTMASLMGLKPSQEYLVNFNFINKVAEQNRLKLVESNIFADIVQDNQAFNEFSQFIKTYCNFNRYQQQNYQQLQQNIISKQHLIKLAELYRYSIWQKI